MREITPWNFGSVENDDQQIKVKPRTNSLTMGEGCI